MNPSGSSASPATHRRGSACQWRRPPSHARAPSPCAARATAVHAAVAWHRVGGASHWLVHHCSHIAPHGAVCCSCTSGDTEKSVRTGHTSWVWPLQRHCAGHTQDLRFERSRYSWTSPPRLLPRRTTPAFKVVSNHSNTVCLRKTTLELLRPTGLMVSPEFAAVEVAAGPAAAVLEASPGGEFGVQAGTASGYLGCLRSPLLGPPPPPPACA